MKVALVHDWLLQQRGGEQVLLALARLFPGAPIYTLVHRPGSVHPDIEAHPIVTSRLQRLPRAHRTFRLALPAFFAEVARFDLSGFDLVLSTSHCAAVGAATGPHQRHVAYVHSPMRYLYDQMEAYLPRPWRRCTLPAARLVSWPLRRRDRRAAQGPQALIANSAFVADRIRRAWGRDAEVVHPPVDVAKFAGVEKAKAENAGADGQGRGGGAPDGAREDDVLRGDKGGHGGVRRGYVCVNALVPYKRTEVCVAWANAAGAPLTVVGRGPEMARLRRLAGPTVRFVPHLPHAALQATLQASEALLFAGEEDFGIAPIEALAAGCPVVALGRGGLRESLVDPSGRTYGALFDRPTPAALGAAVAALADMLAAGTLDAAACRARAQTFAPERFVAQYLAAVGRALGPAWARALPRAPQGN